MYLCVNCSADPPVRWGPRSRFFPLSLHKDLARCKPATEKTVTFRAHVLHPHSVTPCDLPRRKNGRSVPLFELRGRTLPHEPQERPELREGGRGGPWWGLMGRNNLQSRTKLTKALLGDNLRYLEGKSRCGREARSGIHK
jgi:hypothetical protein